MGGVTGVSPLEFPPLSAHADPRLDPHRYLPSFLSLCKYPPATVRFRTSPSTSPVSPPRCTIHRDRFRSSQAHAHAERTVDSVEMGAGSSSGRPLGGERVGKRWNRGGSTVVGDGVGEDVGGNMRRSEEYGNNPLARSRNDKSVGREGDESFVGSIQLGETADGSSSVRPLDGKVLGRLMKDGRSARVAVEGAKKGNHANARGGDGHGRIREVGHFDLLSSVRPKHEKTRNISTMKVGVEKKSQKYKASTPEFQLRVGLDMCSKNGDVMGAISLYDAALRDNTKLEQYHYNVLLYLCSSAAAGVLRPGKSGSVSSGGSGRNLCFAEEDSSNMNQMGDNTHENDVHGEFNTEGPDSQSRDGFDIRSGEDIKNYALTRGLEIYEKICLEKMLLSEAALTSVARMAMTMKDGDMAFNIVKKIKSLGLTLRLRSYGPALFTYCNVGDIDKAFEVEQHMLEAGVHPEEPELAALLSVSIRARRSLKVYYLLQKLRASVRQVSPSTANLIEVWFKSMGASRVGKRKWSEQMIRQAMENRGGGWHGLGWVGKGKWLVIRTVVDVHGFCQGCGEQLVAIDIDPLETEKFSRSVASIAAKRERHSNFQKFQKWLEYYGPFEAVIDAANVGLFSQRRFSLTKVNAVVNGMRQKLSTKKWPLIIVHNKRISGGKMDEPPNVKLVEKWKNADALYATPTGSNDDWYWLYAAVKCKALIVTNDEMRDHIFQVLGNDFFPKWKERHQVHFNFSAGGPHFFMPPACSVVIQESQKGHWHIPILSEEKSEVGRSVTWLCVTRATSPTSIRESQPSHTGPKAGGAATLRTTKSALASSKRDPGKESVLWAIKAAEKFAGQVINFEI